MQSRWMSFVEASSNIVAGFGLAFVTQILVFPMFGIAVSTADNLLIGAVFTVVSLARSFALRRMFNHLSTRRGA
jgi:hypothetical protein